MSDTNGAAVMDPPKEGTEGTDGGVAVMDLPTSLEIDRATWDDMSHVVKIVRSSASWYEDIVDPEDLDEHYVDEAWARKNFESRDFFVGRLGDEIAGTVTLQDAGEDFAYLGYVYLHEDHVGNGFGRDLLDFAREESIRRGKKGMILIAHPEAIWARKAYLRYGFEIVGEEREEVLAWNDGWLRPYYEEGFQLYRYDL